MGRHHELAIVIPMYNPGRWILQVLEHIPPEVGLVVVVDDGSTDGSVELVKNYSDPRVHLVRMGKNCGVGAATWRGLEEAFSRGARVAVKVDADFQMDPRLAFQVAQPVLEGKADFAKANRFLHTQELLQMPLLRRVGNMGLSFLVKAATGYWNIFDPTNGFFAIHRAVFRLLRPTSIAHDFFFEISLLAELGLHRCVVQDVPLPASYPHEVSHLRVWHALLSFPARLARLFVRRLWLQHFVQDFGPMAVSLVFGLLLASGGVAWGVYHWVQSARAGVVTPTGTVMLAALPLIFGFQLLLQALFFDVQSVPRNPIHPQLETNQPPRRGTRRPAFLKTPHHGPQTTDGGKTVPPT